MRMGLLLVIFSLLSWLKWLANQLLHWSPGDSQQLGLIHVRKLVFKRCFLLLLLLVATTAGCVLLLLLARVTTT
jgi:hypothetical protein